MRDNLIYIHTINVSDCVWVELILPVIRRVTILL